MKDQRLERERYWNEVKAAAEYIKSKDNRKFEVALVLGSGLGPIAIASRMLSDCLIVRSQVVRFRRHLSHEATY